MPYLPVNGGHGAITTVGRMRNGIQIWMDDLNSVTIAQDGKRLRLAVVLYPRLLLGPGLGGGHGFLQGRYGLISDNFVSVNIVMADGNLHTIDERSDLWWAIQGAGHNFGIVTSVTSKIYDIEHRTWSYTAFTFTGDKIEQIYQAANDHLNGTQPMDVTNYSFFINLPSIDPNAGVTSVDPAWSKPFQDIGRIATQSAAGDYPNLPAWTGNGNQDPPCQKVGLVNNRFPIDLELYDPEAQRQVYDLFKSATQETPALNGSLFLFEGYSLQAVQAVPKESTAVSYRGDKLLLAPLIIYAPDGPELERKATKLGQDLRQILHKATNRSELHTYINYAFGDETKENMYGSEQWRQDRLLVLKNKYDPHRKFSFYAPIA
ncbi:hypothetical protein DL766_007749 [Monosporascus sp. MC13-8B]|uniref:Berberine/berberine-like domain-containing protein n=1 Tax=Monosporascus cannonballus TaxID=155416 RepID=A0ABY0HKC6_9PEZI|nr:hypothetical protein DL763_005177 [Monosporascus cannonballus]RYO95492.1 hypothetical protein DL762_000054 [Monosporascus cannonballus]RYP22303.1 hypothetical protein DL766_007749 [Monosporascus sp. MC13-8B]